MSELVRSRRRRRCCKHFRCRSAEHLPVGDGGHGYTLFAVEGDGSRGRREADIPEFTNIQIEVIVPLEVAQALLTRLEKEFFPRYGMIAFESDVRVLSQNKF